ncbi:MAG: GNAT family N-acetyltransferase [Nevskiales bacterium]|nr:GNAT family N-acetyltransferase [Nevskiales bacterium]
MNLSTIEITAPDGTIVAMDWLLRAEPVHRQLRPQLPPAYATALERVFAGGGRMVVAVDGADVVGVAVYRIFENTVSGRQLYVDDLVTDEHHRSRGVGRHLLTWLQARAQAQACKVLALDSGVQRRDAHRFYFREGLHIASFSFRKPLD